MKRDALSFSPHPLSAWWSTKRIKNMPEPHWARESWHRGLPVAWLQTHAEQRWEASPDGVWNIWLLAQAVGWLSGLFEHKLAWESLCRMLPEAFFRDVCQLNVWITLFTPLWQGRYFIQKQRVSPQPCIFFSQLIISYYVTKTEQDVFSCVSSFYPSLQSQ